MSREGFRPYPEDAFERIVKIKLAAFDRNRSQHLTPRYTLKELEQAGEEPT